MSTPRDALALPPTVPAILTRLERDGGRPALTWYGPRGERVELSGAVLVNWVTKTTNLLVDELDTAPGTRVLLDLPAHWRTPVWALAAWRAGGSVLLATPDAATGVDVVVTAQPDEHTTGADVVAVALPALARRWDGTLPPGALDAAASVMTYGDVLGVTPHVDASAPALVTREGTVPHADLVARAISALPVPGDGRVALRASGAPTTSLLQSLATWASGGSVVLVHPAAAPDADALDALLRAERVTARVD
ncbi:TIGR03089 family protein [Cellulomonas sp. FA1]|uniref:TIGR03089 family protein n=1 Tax=Cellulomonas sp. FA1 TaxID=1346710 RepID=UPI0006264950|nr:TIGR03089 family protein [Cellulomonas sp. FA1]